MYYDVPGTVLGVLKHVIQSLLQYFEEHWISFDEWKTETEAQRKLPSCSKSPIHSFIYLFNKDLVSKFRISNNTREHSTHGHHQMVNREVRLIIFFAAKDGEALYIQQKRPGADCGSDHGLLIAKFRRKLKKVGKTTRPFISNPLWLYSGSDK